MKKDVTGVVLAGGKSRRMGQDKASLILEGRTLLERQAEKMRALGIADILISGKDAQIPGVRFVPDCVPGCGPLGGLYSCFLTARCPHCLVLSVDTPLIPVRTLAALADAHLSSGADATVLERDGKIEPLIGAYRVSLTPTLETLLRGDDFSVRAFLRRIHFRTFPYEGEEILLTNCNEWSDYETVRAVAAAASADD